MKSGVRRAIGRTSVAVAVAAAAAGLALTGLMIFYAGRFFLPSVWEGTSFSQAVLDRSGALLRLTLSGDEKFRIRVREREVSPVFREVLFMLEDRHFYRHPGVNPASLLRAGLSLGSDRPIGGSTLTMQLSRVRYGLRTRSVFGKFAQMRRAFALEWRHSKREILEAYLTFAPYGANIEGIAAASRVYFGKPPRDLTLAESLLLAVVPQNPNLRNLSEGGGFDGGNLLRARDRLLARWLETHPEDRPRERDLRLPLRALGRRELPYSAPHAVQMALAASPEKSNVRTTLDLKIQRTFERRISEYVVRSRSLGVKNAAVVLVDLHSRELIALVGSRDFRDAEILGQVNGITAPRSPGSTLKPFVYALAMDQGLIHPHTLLKDTPRDFAGFDPENFDRKYSGPLTAEEALTQSRNVPAVALTQRLRPGLYDLLGRTGVRFPRPESHYGLGIALGSGEVTAWDLARLYSDLGNRGEDAPLRLVFPDSSSADPLKADASKRASLFSPEAALLTLEMLAKNIRADRAYSERWMERSYPVAWKTGTSFGFRDAWTAGLVGGYALVVWLGNFDGEGNPAFVGRDLAAPLFFELANLVADERHYDPAWLSRRGLGVQDVEVCAVSGSLPGASCPHRVKTAFIPGVSPIHRCEIHRPILIDRASGKRACRPGPRTKMEVFEFWPSDLTDLFTLAGIHRKSPPPFAEECDANAVPEGTLEIVSPRSEVTYLQSVGTRAELNQIPLRAISDADSRQLFWFANQRFLGVTKPDQSLQLATKVGDYRISVIDEVGRSASRRLVIRAAN